LLTRPQSNLESILPIIPTILWTDLGKFCKHFCDHSTPAIIPEKCGDGDPWLD